MIESKMKAVVFAKKVREQIVKLQKKKALEAKKFEADFAKWQKDFEAWMKANALKRVRGITKAHVKEHKGYHRGDLGFDVGEFFRGCPTAPRFPTESEDRIKKCRTVLRQLAITGQEMVHIDKYDIDKLFGLEDDE